MDVTWHKNVTRDKSKLFQNSFAYRLSKLNRTVLKDQSRYLCPNSPTNRAAIFIDIATALTQSAAKKLHSHCDVAVPTSHIDSHETSQEWPEESMTHNIVSFNVGLE